MAPKSPYRTAVEIPILRSREGTALTLRYLRSVCRPLSLPDANKSRPVGYTSMECDTTQVRGDILGQTTSKQNSTVLSIDNGHISFRMEMMKMINMGNIGINVNSIIHI